MRPGGALEGVGKPSGRGRRREEGGTSAASGEGPTEAAISGVGVL